MGQVIPVEEFLELVQAESDAIEYLTHPPIVRYSDNPIPDNPLLVGVYGSSLEKVSRFLGKDTLDEYVANAEGLGLVLGDYAGSVVLVDGVCPSPSSLPTIASKAAKKRNPNTFRVGISPCRNEKDLISLGVDPNEFDIVVYAGVPPLVRDVINNKIGKHAAIALPGGSGTLHEVAGAYDIGRIIALYDNSGTAVGTKRALDIAYALKDTGAVYFMESDPAQLVQRTFGEWRVQEHRKRGSNITVVNIYRHVGKNGREEIFVNIRDVGRPATDRDYMGHLGEIEVNIVGGLHQGRVLDWLNRHNLGSMYRRLPLRPARGEKGILLGYDGEFRTSLLPVTRQIRANHDVLYHIPAK